MLTRTISSFFTALSFLTIVRLPGKGNKDNLAYATDTFAYVGLAIGIGLMMVHLIFGKASPVLMVIYLAVATRMLHIDGLSDTFDGLFSHRSRDEMLDIMKDSRVGSMGAVAIAICFIAKFQAFTMINSASALLVIPAISRFSMVVLMQDLPYVRKNGLATQFVERVISYPQIIVVIVLSILTMGVMVTICLAIISVVVYFALRTWYKKLIGGITGDMIGAMCEITEMALFLLAGFLI